MPSPQTSEKNVTATQISTSESRPDSQRKLLLTMFVIALLVRLLAMTIGHTYKFRVTEDHFAFGWETGRIARSIALGLGFSNPMHGITGPTAWIAPLYPYFLAGIFKIFGVYSDASAWVALAVNSIFSALTCVTIFFLCTELFNQKVAQWSAWIWALLPYSAYWAIRFAWETSLATFLLSAAFLLAVRLERENSLARWLWFAVVWALIALSNPSLLAFLPFCGIWILYRQRKRGVMRLQFAVLSGALFFACIAPWLARNYIVFDKFIFIRGNFGAELRLGNGPGADGQWMYWLHPTEDRAELAKYRELGEVAYVQQRGHEAVRWIEDHPGRFARISLKRAFFYWFGTPRASSSMLEYTGRNLFFSLTSILAFLGLAHALRQRNRGSVLFLWLFVSVSIVYYFTFTHPRYRHPLEPEMLVLMVYLFSEAGAGELRNCRTAELRN